MNQDLNLTGTEFNLAASVRYWIVMFNRVVLTNRQMFFIPYALFEIPSNVVLKLMRPSRWLTIMVVAWGTVGWP